MSELMRQFAKYPDGVVQHDLLNRQLPSLHFSEVHARLGGLGLEYLDSANVQPNYSELILTADAFEVWQAITAGGEAEFCETTKDLMLNTSQRFDLYRKRAQEGGRERARGLAGLGDLYLKRAGDGHDIEARRQVARAAPSISPRMFTRSCSISPGGGQSGWPSFWSSPSSRPIRDAMSSLQSSGCSR
ncbi:MAG: methyltransferase regulatory domain-containing protein [Gammaproteobacteria bacterium]